MKLGFKGGCKEVGRSALLVNDEILVDYGIKPGETPLYPVGEVHPKAVFVSHGHLDHCGAVANLMDMKPDVFMTPPTADLAHVLARDTLAIAEREGRSVPYTSWELQQMTMNTNKVDTGIEFHAHGYTAQFYNAGHIPGSAAVYLEKDGKSIVYTGDINTLDTRLVPVADELPKADALITESTYFNEDHPSRKETEREFIDSLKDTLDMGGNVLIPAFAIGRTQEILMVLSDHGIPCYVDGMGVGIYKLLMNHPDYLKNPAHLKHAFDNATFVKGRKRSKVPLHGSVIVTTAGMLNGGPVLYYINQLYKDAKSKIMLTGYQVEGTNGRMMLDTGIIDNDGIIQQVRMKVEKYDFSSHCGDRELKQLVKKFCDKGGEKVFTMHGENAEDFATWVNEEIGAEGYAPANGEDVMI
ncbi:putative mRNA 3-end processing factor [Methanococcoides vulcani]|uniref:Putative mRNA 3-end processing factor n=1 Tax=Methanococcoides vulcani TaxID=1353158 RepID=A0A1I0A8V5_9EURY|nr:MBL fold metallo-hydrolase [Methanococcoides vulcani]SES90580.1 putative mRNA 3-end processing factor [Methanococcoides vulcani]